MALFGSELAYIKSACLTRSELGHLIMAGGRLMTRWPSTTGSRRRNRSRGKPRWKGSDRGGTRAGGENVSPLPPGSGAGAETKVVRRRKTVMGARRRAWVRRQLFLTLRDAFLEDGLSPQCLPGWPHPQRPCRGWRSVV